MIDPYFVPKLGVNIDHVATLRQLRGTPYPSLVEAARLVELSGGQQITIHLREDRRHIQDRDVKDLRSSVNVPLNLEMAVAEDILRLAKRIRPDWACLVPEKRNEVTTEGGLDLKKKKRAIGKTIASLKKSGIQVSLFIEPKVEWVRLSRELGADAVEIHTGRYAIHTQKKNPPKKGIRSELSKVVSAAEEARALGLRVHVGHGLDYKNVRPLVEWNDERGSPLIEEYNIGHSIICRSAIVGIERAVREMVAAIAAP